MRKKFLSVFLVLCMALGMLPMSAMAANNTPLTAGSGVTVTVDETTGLWDNAVTTDTTTTPGTVAITVNLAKLNENADAFEKYLVSNNGYFRFGTGNEITADTNGAQLTLPIRITIDDTTKTYSDVKGVRLKEGTEGSGTFDTNMDGTEGTASKSGHALDGSSNKTFVEYPVVAFVDLNTTANGDGTFTTAYKNNPPFAFNTIAGATGNLTEWMYQITWTDSNSDTYTTNVKINLEKTPPAEGTLAAGDVTVDIDKDQGIQWGNAVTTDTSTDGTVEITVDITKLNNNADAFTEKLKTNNYYFTFKDKGKNDTQNNITADTEGAQLTLPIDITLAKSGVGTISSVKSVRLKSDGSGGFTNMDGTDQTSVSAWVTDNTNKTIREYPVVAYAELTPDAAAGTAVWKNAEKPFVFNTVGSTADLDSWKYQITWTVDGNPATTFTKDIVINLVKTPEEEPACDATITVLKTTTDEQGNETTAPVTGLTTEDFKLVVKDSDPEEVVDVEITEDANTEGTYKVSLPAGNYTVTVVNEAYETAAPVDLTVSNGGANTAEITLTPKPAEVEVKMEATATPDGSTASTTVDQTALEKAIEDAKNQEHVEGEAVPTSVEITVPEVTPAAGETISTVDVSLSKDVVGTLNTNNIGVTVKTEVGDVALPNDAVTAIGTKLTAGDSAKLVIDVKDEAAVEAIKGEIEAIKDLETADLVDVTVYKTKASTPDEEIPLENLSGTITLSLPVSDALITAAAGNTNDLGVWHVDGTKLTPETATYDAAAQRMNVTTTHLSSRLIALKSAVAAPTEKAGELTIAVDNDGNISGDTATGNDFKYYIVSSGVDTSALTTDMDEAAAKTALGITETAETKPTLTAATHNGKYLLVVEYDKTTNKVVAAGVSGMIMIYTASGYEIKPQTAAPGGFGKTQEIKITDSGSGLSNKFLVVQIKNDKNYDSAMMIPAAASITISYKAGAEVYLVLTDGMYTVGSGAPSTGPVQVFDAETVIDS